MGTLLTALTALMLFVTPVGAAEELVLEYLCSDMKGSYMGAPQWTVETDNSKDQKVLLAYIGEGNPASVFWIKDGEAYYERNGVGFSMGSGFLIIIVAQDRTESYVFNAGTMELYFNQVRSGNNMLPNTLKGFRGTCAPAGVTLRKFFKQN